MIEQKASSTDGEQRPYIVLTTEKGLRDENQDYAAVLLSRGDRIEVTYPDRKEELPGNGINGTIAIIADGMGGLKDGAKASRLAVEHVIGSLAKASGDPENVIMQSIGEASDMISAQLPGSGTTIVVASITDRVSIFHTGDSRCYIFDGTDITRTIDHSPVDIMYSKGAIGKEEIMTHPMRNVLSYFLGGPMKISEIREKKWKRLLLCTDGAFSNFDEDVMVAYVRSEISPQDLTAKALEAGSKDNITCISIENRDV